MIFFIGRGFLEPHICGLPGIRGIKRGFLEPHICGLLGNMRNKKRFFGTTHLWISWKFEE
jgi:hypothetical protein